MKSVMIKNPFLGRSLGIYRTDGTETKPLK
jgi:hypothetical protein